MLESKYSMEGEYLFSIFAKVQVLPTKLVYLQTAVSFKSFVYLSLFFILSRSSPIHPITYFYLTNKINSIKSAILFLLLSII